MQSDILIESFTLKNVKCLRFSPTDRVKITVLSIGLSIGIIIIINQADCEK